MKMPCYLSLLFLVPGALIAGLASFFAWTTAWFGPSPFLIGAAISVVLFASGFYLDASRLSAPDAGAPSP